jgi:peptidoglycan/xylan/chitin deacetylase (PgdA/CDA1 family)
LCICWHSVEPDSINPAFLLGWNPTVSLFRDQVAFLLEHYTPISIHQFVELSEDPARLDRFKKPPVLLTFDDGFKNVLDHALPVLKEFRVPALFFVMGGTLENPAFVPWFVEATHLLRKTSKGRVVFENTSLDLTSRADRRTAVGLFDAAYKACQTDMDRQRFLTGFSELLEVRRPQANELDDDLRFVTREDLANLSASSQLAVGSHAMTHRFLENLTVEDQRYEIEESHRILSDICPAYFPALAYPGGSFNVDTIALAAKTYRCAFALYAGSSHRNKYMFPRVIIGNDSVKDLAYTISHLRLTYLLPVKRLLQTVGMR